MLSTLLLFPFLFLSSLLKKKGKQHGAPSSPELSSVRGRNSVSTALLVADCALRNYFFLLEVLRLISSRGRANVIQTSGELKQTWQLVHVEHYEIPDPELAAHVRYR